MPQKKFSSCLLLSSLRLTTRAGRTPNVKAVTEHRTRVGFRMEKHSERKVVDEDVRLTRTCAETMQRWRKARVRMGSLRSRGWRDSLTRRAHSGSLGVEDDVVGAGVGGGAFGKMEGASEDDMIG